jgi:hypothetical protein
VHDILALAPFQPAHGEMRSRNLLKVGDESVQAHEEACSTAVAAAAVN